MRLKYGRHSGDSGWRLLSTKLLNKVIFQVSLRNVIMIKSSEMERDREN